MEVSEWTQIEIGGAVGGVRRPFVHLTGRSLTGYVHDALEDLVGRVMSLDPVVPVARAPHRHNASLTVRRNGRLSDAVRIRARAHVGLDERLQRRTAATGSERRR